MHHYGRQYCCVGIKVTDSMRPAMQKQVQSDDEKQASTCASSSVVHVVTLLLCKCLTPGIMKRPNATPRISIGYTSATTALPTDHVPAAASPCTDLHTQDTCCGHWHQLPDKFPSAVMLVAVQQAVRAHPPVLVAGSPRAAERMTWLMMVMPKACQA